MDTKWHYFNENDGICKFESFPTKNKITYYTACGRKARKIRRHTEDKNKVDCLICLNFLNRRTDDANSLCS
uniref:Uncharacterized protein n=1 Tax=viral metagenome TaxID=1070528 RepID=A0A6M3K8S6_9ZZZZ